MTSNVISQAQLVPTSAVGFADIVGFGRSGVEILRNGADQAFLAIEEFGINQGWLNEIYDRLLCDMDGNNELDIVGFGDKGVSVSFNNGDNTFTPSQMVIDDFGYNAGWRVDKHVRFTADIRKVGRCDIIGFGDAGVYVSQNNGDRTFSTAKLVLTEFGHSQGWEVDEHLRFLAPITANGIQDIVGFGDQSVFVARNNGDGTFAPAKKVLDNFCFVQGWRVEDNPRFLADLTGHGWVDIVGFGDEGVYVSLNDGNGDFVQANKVLDNFGTLQGWRTSLTHPRLIADLRGTKRGDIIGFGDDGVYVSFNNGDGTFQPANLVLNNFGVNQGWQKRHPRFVVDLNGDGCADIIGFGEKHVFVSINDGKGGFGIPQALTTTFSYDDGWDTTTMVRYLANLHKDHSLSKEPSVRTLHRN